MIEILIVDDHPVMRELLRQVLEAYLDVSVIAEAFNGEDAVRKAIQLQPAVAIVDIHMPTMSGIETTKIIKQKCPSTVVIGLTAGEPDVEDLTMISAGAACVINKADVFWRLYRAIVDSMKGHLAEIPACPALIEPHTPTDASILKA
jgi:DNA-binding NarL/FixJ family response regulator